MPYTPPALVDGVSFASAPNVMSWLQTTGDYADAQIASTQTSNRAKNAINVLDQGIVRNDTSGPAVTANTAAANSLFAGLPIGSAVYFPAGTYTFNPAAGSQIGWIKPDGITIFGDSFGSSTLRLATGCLTGTFFRVGDNALGAGGTTEQFTIRDLELRCANAVPDLPAVHCLWLTNTVRFNISRLRLTNIAGFLRLGTDETDPRLTAHGNVNQIEGSYADVGVNGVILCRTANAVNFTDIIMLGAQTTQGTTILLEPYNIAGSLAADSAIEPLRFTNVILWADGANEGQVTGQPTGQPYNVRIVLNNGGLKNVWFQNCEFDWASTAAVYIAATSGTYVSRYIKFDGCYLGTHNAGNSVFINYNGTSPGALGPIQFTRCRMSAHGEPPIRIQGSGTPRNIHFAHNEITDVQPGVAKSAALSTTKGHFSFVSNHIMGVDGSVTNFSNATEVSSGQTSYVITGNNVDRLASGGAMYTGPAADTNKIVGNNAVTVG